MEQPPSVPEIASPPAAAAGAAVGNKMKENQKQMEVQTETKHDEQSVGPQRPQVPKIAAAANLAVADADAAEGDKKKQSTWRTKASGKKKERQNCSPSH